MVLMCKIDVKYRYANRAVCAMNVFLKQPGCAFIGACVLIRMNAVYPQISEPPRGKTNNVVSEQVRHKPTRTSTEKS